MARVHRAETVTKATKSKTIDTMSQPGVGTTAGAHRRIDVTVVRFKSNLIPTTTSSIKVAKNEVVARILCLWTVILDAGIVDQTIIRLTLPLTDHE
jgi:hypothetical protein